MNYPFFFLKAMKKSLKLLDYNQKIYIFFLIGVNFTKYVLKQNFISLKQKKSNILRMDIEI